MKRINKPDKPQQKRKPKKKTRRYNTANQKKANFLIHLIRNNFHLRKTCLQTDTKRLNYYQWLRDDPEFVKKIEQMREMEVDLFEDAFRELVEERNVKAVIFGLKTRGKNRGYVEKHEIEHSGGQTIEFNIVQPEQAKIIKEGEEKKQIESDK